MIIIKRSQVVVTSCHTIISFFVQLKRIHHWHTSKHMCYQQFTKLHLQH